LIIKKLLSDYKYNGQKIAIQLSDKIYDARNQTIHIAGLQEPICVKNSLLHGRHNLKNIIITASILSKAGLQAKDIERGLPTFKPLEHRLEDLGVVADIRFINDSISTIPESTIEAIHTLLDVDTIILGGHDRGVNYNKLVNLLADSAIRNLIFMGGAGERMMRLFAKKNRPTKNLFFVNRMSETEKIIVDYTQKDKICLLSPAAASYDQFNNFEERGRAFKAMINSIKEKHELPDKDNP